MAQTAVLPASGAAKLAITLTAVSAGASLGLFSATWLTAGLAVAVPLLVCGVLLLEFGAFMWKGTPSAYAGCIATSAGLYVYSLVGMAGFLPTPDAVWHIAGLGALSVLCTGVIVFAAVFLREAQAHARAERERAAAKASAPHGSGEAAKAAHDSN